MCPVAVIDTEIGQDLKILIDLLYSICKGQEMLVELCHHSEK